MRAAGRVMLAAGWAAAAAAGPDLARLIPSGIAPRHSNLDALTAGLRQKAETLGLNAQRGLEGEKISRVLVLLPKDRAKAGVISFEIEEGPAAGIYQCEALGRGVTSREPRAGWLRGVIGGATVYYAPMASEDGAALPGIYDLRNISPREYEIELLNKPEELGGDADIAARIANPDGSPKARFSGVWKHWYSRTNQAMPIDMVWAEDYQAFSQGAGVPVFERRSLADSPQARARQAKQLARNARYYYGPFGRTGWAIHTDQWDDPQRGLDPAYAGRPELSNFLFRDTNGCVKVRPDCLALLNLFVDEQSGKKRRVQCEVRETELLDTVAAGVD
ncbi:MAG TPA: hypothetical protein DCP85_01730 [Elusimicrobia bacterium]|nr:hypothetical protein [Elusimicrobiota bacterium]